MSEDTPNIEMPDSPVNWQRTISNGERTTASCMQRWFLRYGLGLLETSKPRAMYLGTVWAEAMDAYGRDGLTGALARLDAVEDKHLGGIGAQFLSSFEDTGAAFVLCRDMLARYDAHWRGREPDLGRVVLSEHRLVAPIPSPGGGASWKTYVGGYLDKLTHRRELLDDGLWVVEHKTTSTPLNDWLARNEYKPQGYTYAWLVEQVIGRPVRGIIFDVALSVRPTPADEFEPIANGSRLRKPNGLPTTTADRWASAIKRNGFRFDGEPWYVEIGRELRKREERGHWFRRFVVPYLPAEIQRAGAELYPVLTQLRQQKEATAPLRAQLRDKLASPFEFGELVESIVREHATAYPRNAGLCYQYNRPCEYLDLCRHQSREAAGAFTMRTSKGTP